MLRMDFGIVSSLLQNFFSLYKPDMRRRSVLGERRFVGGEGKGLEGRRWERNKGMFVKPPNLDG